MATRPKRTTDPAQAAALDRALDLARTRFKSDVAAADADPFPDPEVLKRALTSIVNHAAALEKFIEKLDGIDDGLCDSILANVDLHSRGRVRNAVVELKDEALHWKAHAYDFRRGKIRNKPLAALRNKIAEEFDKAGVHLSLSALQRQFSLVGHNVSDQAACDHLKSARLCISKRRASLKSSRKNLLP